MTVLPDWIPEWVSDLMRDWCESGKHGSIRLNYKAGVVSNANEERSVLPPATRAKGGIACPECQKPMREQDYGNLYLCACGTKRTRSQILRAGLIT